MPRFSTMFGVLVVLVRAASAQPGITNDPAIAVDDPNVRTLAQALMVEGVTQLKNKAYDQALANFLEAYAKFPSPKILLHIASTLRDMGRQADAANTYQRYLLDPATGAERFAEVKELLLKLDERLTTLTVRVAPRGSEVSIDGGPFISVGSSLRTRVRPGIHLVRVRASGDGSELSLNGFEGETKEVTVQVTAPTTAPPVAEVPDRVEAWLQTGTQYGSDGTGGRTVRTGFSGPELSPIVPAFDIGETTDVVVHHDDASIRSGVLGVVRIDGQGRGLAGGLGLAVSFGRFAGDVMVLRSNLSGGYLGGRYRFMPGRLRPYGALGLPAFLYDEMDANGGTSKRLALGVRAAAGVELEINGHLSVHVDLGYERFFAVEETLFYSNYFIPTVGVIGRL